jgi:hypothetical protein
MSKRMSALGLAVVCVVAIASCGDDSGTPTTQASTVEESTTVAGATQDSAVAQETTVADSAAPSAAAGVAVTMKEFTIDAPTTLTAGSNTFTLTNAGEFDHELAVAKGDSYDTLPQLESGAVDEDKLGADFIGRGEKVRGGGTDTVTFDLPAGNYVLFCNLGQAPNNHAAKGQVLSVKVA